MINYINYICIHNKEFESRFVNLKTGVNIIVGQSKTGKSALVEIIDYCYCSKQCTIPKGIILDFGEYFSLIMTIGNSKYLICRENPKIGGKMLFVRVNENFHPDSINKGFIDSHTFKQSTYVQHEIEKVLGLRVDNFSIDSSKKASMRNMVSYLFQHQNLMASKFALFYRFSDLYKRKDVVEQFPIFAGFVDQKYYSLLVTRNDLKLRIKQVSKMLKNNENVKKELEDSFIPLIKNYLSLIGVSYKDDMNFDDAMSIAKKLPEISLENYDEEKSIMSRYDSIKSEIETLRFHEQQLQLKIQNVEKANKSGTNLVDSLYNVRQKASFRLLKSKEEIQLICPLCQSHINDDENEKIMDTITSSIDNDIEEIKVMSNAYYEESRKLNNELTAVVRNIKKLYKQKKEIEEKYIGNGALKENIITEAKSRIKVFLELMEKQVFDVSDDELSELNLKLLEIEKSLSAYGYDIKIKQAEKFIMQNMNRIGNSLNFEDEYKPLDMHFHIEENDFKFYLKKGNDSINLYEMGSGANWVSCHIALFLSLIRYFCKEPHNCMLKTMFFDQPSQVYYSNNRDTLSDDDSKSVRNIYQTIINEINEIANETTEFPQIIIVDHANLPEFKEYVRVVWNDKNKLI